jgi:uncharacterized protein
VYDLLHGFYVELRKGKFLVAVCSSCKFKVWPPSKYCPQCHSKTALETVETSGTLIEYTRSYLVGKEGTYGLVDMSGIRLIGSFDTSELVEGQQVRMLKCGVNPDGTTFYLFEPV